MALKVINVVLTGDATSLRAALISSAREVDRFGDKVTGVSKTGVSSAQLLAAGIAAAGVAVGAGLAVAVKGASDFEAAMRNVNSISGLSEAAFRAQGAAVLDLSRELPQSAKTLAEGLYEIASSGFQGAEGLEVLEHSAKAASAGLTNTQTSAKAIVGVLNAYGLEASEAARVSDVLFQTVNLGVLSFEELAQNMGDVVGISAAAGISIEQVGAAIAAITLSGVPAAEAFTQLKELTRNLIKPSEELSTVYRALGINITRDLADPAIGLRGVMEQLRTATGGNVEALLALFPTVRAAGAAFALAANDGENYRRTAEGIGQAQDGAGATAKAFNEQLKGLSAQFKVFVNGIQAGAIELGTHLLPILSDTLRAMQSLGADAMPALQSSLAALAPFFAAVAQVGGDVVDIVKQLIDNLSPVAKAIAGLVAIGVIGALNGLAEALSAISGVLAEQPELLTGLVAAWGTWLAITKAAALVNLAKVFASGPILSLTTNMHLLSGAFGTTAGSVFLLKTALLGLGLGAVVLAAGAAFNGLQKAKDGADALYRSITKDFDLTSYSDLSRALDEIGTKQMELESNTKSQGGLFNAFRGAVELITPMKNSVQDTREEVSKLNAEAERLAGIRINTFENLNSVAEKTGLSRKAVEDLAKVLKVDLTQSFEASGDARTKLIDHYADLIKAAHGGGEAAKAAATLSIEALQEQATAAAEMAKKVSEAFSGATDIVKGFSADVAKEKGLKTFLSENLAAAQTFASQIQDAAKRGLDPAIITRLLQAGPEAAAPFLQAIAADHSGNLIELANQTEKALGEINTKVVAFARLTQQAVNSVDDQKVRALGDAMRITAEVFETDGARTAEAISTKLGIPLERVKEVAREYGITLGGTAAPAEAAKAAAEGFGAALDGLPAKLVENGRSLDGNTEAGRRNRAAIEGVIEKALAHVGALGEQGATMDQQRGAFDRHMGDLRRTMEQAGYSKDEIDGMIGSIHAIPGDAKTTITLPGADGVLGTLDDIKTSIYNIPSYKQINIHSVYTQSGTGREYGPDRPGVGQADGGILRFYAAGGVENHVAQIAPGGSWRVWAEPETGGEAYIPLSPSKRGRSTNILSAVAEEFGYGLTAMANGGFTPAMTPATVTAGTAIDYDRLGRVIGDRIVGALSTQPKPVIEVNGRVLGEVVSKEQYKARRR